MATYVTIEDIEKIDRAMLLPEHIARIMHMDPQAIRVYARTEKKAGREPFPFPTVIYGEKGVVRFPKLEFLEWAKKNKESDGIKSASSQTDKGTKAVKCRPIKRHGRSVLSYQYGT